MIWAQIGQRCTLTHDTQEIWRDSMSNVSERFGKPGMILIMLLGLLGVIVLGGFILSGLVIVENRKAVVLIKKTGDDLPDGNVLAAPDQKGIQLDMLPEGWFWR